MGGHPQTPGREESLHSLRTGTEGCTSCVILAEAGIQKMLTVGSVSRTESHSEGGGFPLHNVTNREITSARSSISLW